jgi:gamma-glutamyltranspeptidase/glutathione hydrolase
VQHSPAGFGTGAIPKDCGFTLQNRGTSFTLLDGHPNNIAGGKRPYHTIIPGMVTQGSDLLMSYGVMGGFMQPQGHVQVLLNKLRGLSPQQCIDAPRLSIGAGLPGQGTGKDQVEADSEIYLEDGVKDEVVEELRGESLVSTVLFPVSCFRFPVSCFLFSVSCLFSLPPMPHFPLRANTTAMGHNCILTKDYARSIFGRGQMIQAVQDPSGRRVWACASDGRGDGCAGAQI